MNKESILPCETWKWSTSCYSIGLAPRKTSSWSVRFSQSEIWEPISFGSVQSLLKGQSLQIGSAIWGNSSHHSSMRSATVCTCYCTLDSNIIPITLSSNSYNLLSAIQCPHAAFNLRPHFVAMLHDLFSVHSLFNPLDLVQIVSFPGLFHSQQHTVSEVLSHVFACARDSHHIMRVVVVLIFDFKLVHIFL